MKAIVIGAGAGGLAVANMLAASGYAVTILEAQATPGGRMGQLQSDGFTFDTGPSWYLMPEVFEHYFSLFNKKPSDYYSLQRLNPAYKVFYQNNPSITIFGELQRDAATFESLELGAGEKLQAYVHEAHNIYQTALTHFLYNPFKSYAPLLRDPKLVALSPKLLAGLTRPLHSHVAKHFSDFRLQQILEYAMVFLGTSPFSAPSLYRLMSYLDFKQGVYFPEKGMFQVTKALELLGTHTGVTYHYKSAVDSIAIKNGRAIGVYVQNTLLPADVVVSNADLAYTETKLVAEPYQSYPQSYWQHKQAAPAALLLYLGVSGKLPNLEHHNLLFVSDWKKNFTDIYENKRWPKPASMYVSRTTATDKSVAPKGHENIFVLVPLPPGKRLTVKAQSELVEYYIDQLAAQTGISDFARRIVYKQVRGPMDFSELFHAWQNSALGLNHVLRQSALFRPSVHSKKVSNLYYVGGMTQPGIGVPMCLISAELVLKAMCQDRSPGPLKRIPTLS